MKEISITEETNFNNPSLERPHPIETEGGGKGIQKIWRFKNDFGASVVRFWIGSLSGSYGAEEGKWELAVVKFTNNGNDFALTYKTKITDDVIGHLSEEEVEEYLKKIKRLRRNKK